MSANLPKAQRSPRRKAGRKAVHKAKRTLTFRLVVEAQEMIVSYEPNWSEGEFACGHFEFRSPHEPPRRIPVSETGYRSHFAPMAEIESYTDPEQYARAFVLACLSRSEKANRRLPGNRQLSLF
jgi:hypothetical protein